MFRCMKASSCMHIVVITIRWCNVNGIQRLSAEEAREGLRKVVHWCRCGRAGKWEEAVDLFLGLQMAGTEATKGICLALLGALEACGQARPALQVRPHSPII